MCLHRNDYYLFHFYYVIYYHLFIGYYILGDYLSVFAVKLPTSNLRSILEQASS